jgi:hypothetical protein
VSSIYPADRKPGCLPRKEPFGKLFAPASEKIKIIPREEWGDYAGKISMRPFVKTILNQGSVGSCATEAVTQAVMVARAFAGLPHIILNPWFIYYHTSGGRDRGSSIDENLAFIREHGIAPMSVWGRDKGWQTEPSSEAYDAAKAFRDFEFFDIAAINEMVSSQLGACPVVYGSKGHAVLKIEHVNDSEGLDVNSWGEDWKDGGFGVWASYRAVNFNYGAFAVRAIR